MIDYTNLTENEKQKIVKQYKKNSTQLSLLKYPHFYFWGL